MSVLQDSAAAFKRLAQTEVLLFHHNDADGLSSGAILAQAFERRGLKVRRFCLEKPYPEVLGTLLQDPDLAPGTVIVFADFASGMLRRLVELNRSKFPLFVIDHHSVEIASDEKLFLVNCTSFGIPSDPNCSASAIAFLFAVALDSANADLAWVGVLGAVGDGLLDAGRLVGINSLALERALESNSVKFEQGEYFLRCPQWTSAKRLATDVNALGGFGYFRGGPDVGVKGLRDGCNEAFFATAGAFRAEFQNSLQAFLAGEFLVQGKAVQWFKLDGKFSAFGVKSVGLVCEELISRNIVDENKYLAGFQTVPDEVPGLGRVRLNQIKVSMRLPTSIRSRVKSGKLPALSVLLPEATRAVGGFIDACHPHAAATTIPCGSEEQLIAALEAAASRTN